MSKRHLAAFAALLFATLAAACAAGEGPLGDAVGDVQSRIHFDLSSRVGPLEACNEADEVAITVSPSGDISPGPRQVIGSSVGPTPPCDAIFEVTIKKGREARFTGEVFGAGRLLLNGAETLPAEQAKDGFVVRIGLTEIPALEVETRTIGIDPVSGPITLRYSFTVDGAPGERIEIGATDIVPVNALAARDRLVELDATPCSVINGPRERDVTVPVPTPEVGAVLYEIDCGGGAGIRLINETCGNVSFQLSIDDGVPIPFPAGGVHNATGLAAGRHKFELVGIPPNLQVTVSPDNPVFLDVPAGGAAQLEFTAQCLQSRQPVALDIRFIVQSFPGSPIPGPINVLVDGAVKWTIAPTSSRNFTITLKDIVEGSRGVTLDFGAVNCMIMGRTPPIGSPIPVPGPVVEFVLRCDAA